VWVWVRRTDVLEIHPQPHDGFLDFRHGQRTLAASTRRATVAPRSQSALVFDSLQDFIEVFAPLFRIRRSKFCVGHMCVYCGFRVPRTANKTCEATAGKSIVEAASYLAVPPLDRSA